MIRKGIWLVALWLAASLAQAQTDVLVSHYDSGRTGQNLNETTLTPSNVNVGTFGKVYAFAVDGYTYAQPLYKSNLTIPGKGTFNVAFVATEHGSVYALDADAATPLWRQSFINPGAGLTSRTTNPSLEDIVPEVSITSTPVIDAVSGTLYVVAETIQSGAPAYYYLHALDITTGADKVTPARIQASVGSGVTPLTIDAGTSQQRPGLVLSNGVVYIGFGSSGDNFPWVGWLLGYNATTLTRVAVFCTSADGSQGAGVWLNGEAPPVDANGNIFISTGNGTFNGSTDWADSIIKLSTAGGLSVSDFFSPFNQVALGNADLDMASAGITLLPDSAGTSAHPHLLVGSDKDGEVYVLDRDHMGGYQSSYNTPNSQIVQWIPGAVGVAPINPANATLPYVENSYTTPAFWQNRVYFCGVNDSCKLFTLNNGLLSTSPASQSPTTFAFGGAEPVVSAASSSATSGVMWAVERDTTHNVTTLHAYDATNLATELYNSNQAAGQRDQGGVPVKFVVPTVTGGKVFIGAGNELDVYGMLGSNPPRLAVPVYAPAAGTYAAAQSVSISANSGSSIYYTLDGTLPTLSSAVYTGPIVVSATTTINAIAVQKGNLTSPAGTATYTFGAPPSPAFVQGNYATPQSAQASVSVPFTSAQGAGDLNVVVVGWNDSTATVKSVTDSSGNVYQLAIGPTVYSGAATQSIYYAFNIVGAGANANTVTVTFNGSAAAADIRILEYSGIAATSPLDATAAAIGSGTVASSGVATTTNANDLIFGADLTLDTTIGAGSGFTSRMITVPDSDIAEDRIVTATGSYLATASVTVSPWIMQMAAFKAATSSGGGGTGTPSAPANLAATAAGTSAINLSWGAATESGGTISQYLIERCQGSGCSTFIQIGTSTTTTFADTGLATTTSYSYRVRAQDSTNHIGPYSNTATASTSTSAPSAPTNLAASAAGGVQINLSWGAATESGGTVSQYLIERCQGSGCSSFAQIGTSSTLSFSNTGLAGSTSYSYRVRAQDSVGNTGPYSNVSSATTAAPVLTAPTNLTATSASSTQINLAWTAATETGGTISQYLIERCQGSGCSTFTQVATASGTAYNDIALSASTSYSYRVRATDAAGNLGPYSNTAGATTGSTVSPPAITFVQGNYATPQSTQTPVTVPFTAAQGSGDLNIVVVGWNDSTATVGTVTDSSGNVYHLAVGPTVYSGSATQSIYYAFNIVGAAANANTVTVTFSTPAAYPDIRILEYSGIAATSPLDVSAAAIGSSTVASSGAATTTNANDLIFGADLTLDTTIGAGSGFTSRMITVPDSDIAEDRIVTATGSYLATASVTVSPWIMQMAAFKAATSSGGGGTGTPSAPANLAATAAGTSAINLSWGAATESGGTISQYLIERCQGSGCSTFIQIGTSTTTTFADTGLATTTSYSYRVRAQDSTNHIGPYSNTATASTSTSAPSAPTNLAASAAGGVQINLSWGAATESGGTVSQYLIERCQGSGCSSFAQIGTSSTLSFSNTGLAGSTSYSYRVRAQDSVGNTGPYSNVSSATTAAPVLTAPTNLTATSASSTQINLAWTAATETGGTISQYLIERCQGSGCSTFTQVATASGTAYNDIALSASTSYSYRVRATDAAGNLGPYSNTAGATTGSTVSPPAITFVQGNYATPQSTQTPVTVPFTAAQGSGDLNIVVVGWNDSTATVGTVTDSSGNVYHLAVGPTVYSGSATQSIYYAFNIVGAAANANTVTVTFSTPAAYPDIRILEYSGIAATSPLDASAAAIGSGTVASSGAATTTNANDLIFGANLTVTETTGAGSGFTSRMITVPDSDIAEDRIVTATGSYAATALTTPGAWIMQMAAFRRHP